MRQQSITMSKPTNDNDINSARTVPTQYTHITRADLYTTKSENSQNTVDCRLGQKLESERYFVQTPSNSPVCCSTSVCYSASFIHGSFQWLWDIASSGSSWLCSGSILGSMTVLFYCYLFRITYGHSAIFHLRLRDVYLH